MPASNPITRNFWLKFFSLALATVIWLSIHYGIRNELSITKLNINRINVPVTVVAEPGDPRIFRVTPAEVVVFAVGDVSSLRRSVRASVDVTDLHTPQSLAEEVHVQAPPEINILEVSPQSVSIQQISR